MSSSSSGTGRNGPGKDPGQLIAAADPADHRAKASVDGDGAILISTGKPKVVVDVFFEPLCPPCGIFEQDYGEELAAKADKGLIAIRLWPVAFLEQYSASGDYSSRVTAALYRMADDEKSAPGSVWTTYAALLTPSVMPRERGEWDWSSAALAALAEKAGADPKAVAAIAVGSLVADGTRQAADNERRLTDMATRVAVPAVFIDGAQIDAKDPAWIRGLPEG